MNDIIFLVISVLLVAAFGFGFIFCSVAAYHFAFVSSSTKYGFANSTMFAIGSGSIAILGIIVIIVETTSRVTS